VKNKITKKYFSKFIIAELILLFVTLTASQVWALASNNIPLDSPVYFYLEKLAGFGLLDSDVKGLKP